MIPYCESWGNCQRIYYLANELVKEGYIVWVVSSKNGLKNKTINKEILFNQIFVEDLIQNHQITNSNKTKQNTLSENKIFSLIKQLIKFIVYKLEKLIFNEPSPLAGIIGLHFSNKAKILLKDIIMKENISKVIISAPPFSLFSIASFIKKNKLKTKIILDYRDPWNLWNGGSFLSNYFEKKYLKIANHIVVTTDNLKKDLINKFKIEDKISIIYNGYSKESWDKINFEQTNRSKKIRLSYIGDISLVKGSYRDLSEFFKAYNLIKERNIFKIQLIGLSVNDQIKELELKYPEIDFIPKVSPEESYKYMINSDILMNIHTTNDNSSFYLIGGKIFDYLKAKKPILSINSKKSFEQMFLKDKAKTYFTENDYLQILKTLKLIAKEKNLNHKSLSFNIEQFSREFQNKKFINLIDKI
jgi:hypothetical protein